MIEIVPAIIAKTKEEFQEMVQKVEPHTSRIHIDVMDGVFVPNTTFNSFEEVKGLKPDLKIDVHLMVADPGTHLLNWYQTQAERLFIHAEAHGRVKDLLAQIQGQGKKSGLVLNPETQIDSILEYLPMVDYIQFMGVHPGSYGAAFVDTVLTKITDFRNQHPDIPIVIDGSIHESTARSAVTAGANILVLGSHIFSEGRDVGEAINEIKKLFNYQ